MKFLKYNITRKNSKVHVIWGFIVVFSFIFGVIFQQWQINKYEVQLNTAMYVAPYNINRWALKAANKWEELAKVRSARLREYVNTRLMYSYNELKKQNNKLKPLGLPKR